MAFSRQEVYEYLAGYPQDTIPTVLTQLGHDENSEEYPDDVVERAEGIYQAMGIAADMQKRLSAATPQQKPQSTEIVAQQVGAIAFQLLEQQGISLPLEVIAALAQSKVEEAIELADKLSDLQEKAFVTRSTHNNARFAQRLLGLSEQSSEIIEAVLGEEAQADWIASNTPATQLNGEVTKFLGGLDARKKARNQMGAAKTETIAKLPPQDTKGFLKAFLAARNA